MIGNRQFAKLTSRICPRGLVESSEAPKLTVEVLKTKGKPVKTVENVLGRSDVASEKSGTANRLEVEVAHLKILEEYLGQEQDPVAMDERDRAVANLLLGKTDV